MSLIADALKTAQREKQRRQSGGRASISPVLVPLRVQEQPSFSWRRALMMAVSGIIIIVSVAVMFERMKNPARPASSPQATSSVAAAPVAADSSRSSARRRTRALALASSDSARAIQSLPARLQRPVSRVARSPSAPAAVKRDGPAVLQGRPSADTGSPASGAASRDNLAGGRLRIAIEEPRLSDSARLFAEALAAHRAGDLAVARALYERVLQISPNDADALNNLGVLFSGDHEFDRALSLLRRAASVTPRNAGIWNNIGAALREQGRASDAVAAYQHALTIDPRHQGARIGLAQQYLAMGLAPQARDILEDVLRVNPMAPEAQYALGQVLELQGDRDGAIRAYTAFMRLAPPRLASNVDQVRRHVDSLSSRVP